MEKKMKKSRKNKSLSLDLEYNILSRLSLKHLYRFKCVCKDWRDLISSQHFLKLHRQLHASHNSEDTVILIGSSIFSHDFHSNVSTDLSHLTCYASEVANFDIHDDRILIGSCNGLLCFDDNHDAMFFVYNPLTGACKKITEYVKRNPEPASWFTKDGFGYDCYSDDYKILSLYTAWRDKTLVEEAAYIYSFKANSWKVIKNDLICRGLNFRENLTSGPRGCVRPMVMTNNALHWLIPVEENHKFVIASFDLGKEVYSDILPPVGLNISNDSRVNLTLLKSCLHILHYSAKDLSRMEVWIMKEYGFVKSWTNVFQCSLINELRGTIPLPCAYSEDGQEIIVAMLGYTQNFVFCNLQRQKVSSIRSRYFIGDQYSTILPWKGFLGSPIDD